MAFLKKKKCVPTAVGLGMYRPWYIGNGGRLHPRRSSFIGVVMKGRGSHDRILRYVAKENDQVTDKAGLEALFLTQLSHLRKNEAPHICLH